MPIFQYKCRDCFSVAELMIGRVADEKKICCLECGKKDVVRLNAPFFATVGGCEKAGECGGDHSDGCNGSCGR